VEGTEEAPEQPPSVEETVTAAPAPAVPALSASSVKVRAGTRTPLSAQLIAEGGKVPATKPREAAVRTKVVAGKAAVKPPPASEPASTEPRAAQAVPDAQAEAEALGRYEAGNAEQALALARRAHLETLASTLARFQEEWTAGTAALTAQDSASAIQHLSTALELDQQLSKGWSAYGPRIRKALAQAHLHAGSGPGDGR
jgi:hypothetical protein